MGRQSEERGTLVRQQCVTHRIRIDGGGRPPRELAPDQLGADPTWLASLTPEPATSAGPLDPILSTPGAPG